MHHLQDELRQGRTHRLLAVTTARKQLCVNGAASKAHLGSQWLPRHVAYTSSTAVAAPLSTNKITKAPPKEHRAQGVGGKVLRSSPQSAAPSFVVAAAPSPRVGSQWRPPACHLLVQFSHGLPSPSALMDGLSIHEMRARLPDGVPPYEMIAINSLDGFLSTTTGIRSPFLDEVFPCECRYYEGTAAAWWLPIMDCRCAPLWRHPSSSTKREFSFPFLDATPDEARAQACGEHSNCINRTLSIECNPDECPCRSHCRNQRFQRGQCADIEVFPTPGKGFGLRTRQDLEPGQLIVEYVGEVLSQEQFEERAEAYSQEGQQHFYFMTLQTDQIIDATKKGNISRFMNHSCNPNCATQKWIVNGQLRIGLFSLRRIKAPSELTFDYKYIRFGERAQKCLCGEANCKGVIGEEQRETAARMSPPSRRTAQEDAEMLQAMELFTGDSGLECVKDVDLIARLLLRCEDPPSTIPLLATIKKTEDPALLTRFITLHGLQIINMLMGTHWRNREILEAAIGILQSLPVKSRSFIEDSHIEEKLERLSENDQFGGELGSAASALLSAWSRLESTYRIPKAALSRIQREERSDVRPSMSDPRAALPVIPNSPSSLSSSSATSSIGYFLGHGISEHYDKKPRWDSLRSVAPSYNSFQESLQQGGTPYAQSSSIPPTVGEDSSGSRLGGTGWNAEEAPLRANAPPNAGDIAGGIRPEDSGLSVEAPQHTPSSLPTSGNASNTGLRSNDSGRNTDASQHRHSHMASANDSNGLRMHGGGWSAASAPQHANSNYTGRDGAKTQRLEDRGSGADEPEQSFSRSTNNYSESGSRPRESSRSSNLPRNAHHGYSGREPSSSDSHARSPVSSEAHAGKSAHSHGSHLQHSLPEGWLSATSPEGKTYYFHQVTRETSWDPPPNPPKNQRAPPPSSHVDKPREWRDHGAASASFNHQSSNLPPSNATEDTDRKLQEIIEKAKRSVRERNESAQPNNTISHGEMGHLKDSTVSVTNRAKSSKSPSAGGGDALKGLEGRLRSLISAVVTGYLEKWCHDQIPSQKDLQDLSRKLTHGIIDKEMRHLAQESARSVAMSSSDAQLLSPSKKAKIRKYLAQYLRLHGYRVDDPEGGQQSRE